MNMDNKVLIDADCKYGDNVDGGRSIFGKELLENETVMEEFIKSFENDAALKVVCYYKSSDDKREFELKSDAIQYELLCHTCNEIMEMEDKRAALVKLVRFCGDVITSYKNYDYKNNFYPIADIIEKKQHCAIHCLAWRILSDFDNVFPCLYSTYMQLACLVLSEN